MDEIAELTARLEALEIQSAHQDRVVEDLNQTITDLWKQIEVLRRQVVRIDDELREVEAGMPAPPVQKPPHY